MLTNIKKLFLDWWRLRPYTKTNKLNDRMLYYGVFISCWVMYALLFTGFCSIGEGVYTYFCNPVYTTSIIISSGVGEPAQNPPLPRDRAITMAVHGLEFIFLAPLAYFLLLSVTKYIQVTAPQSTASVLSVEDRIKEIEGARAELLIVKAFNVSLIIAVISTSILGAALIPGGLKYESTICATLLIVVLGAYFVVLERFANSIRKNFTNENISIERKLTPSVK